jgi:hypothetical protein
VGATTGCTCQPVQPPKVGHLLSIIFVYLLFSFVSHRTTENIKGRSSTKAVPQKEGVVKVSLK